jgi:site-specific DNA-cytosine methylase
MDIPSDNSLATLDIFAGYGGLSKGLQLAGMYLSCRS